MRRRSLPLPTSLTARLVATAVALVAIVGVLVSVATTLAMRSYLEGRLDTELAQAVNREQSRTQFSGRDRCPLDLAGTTGDAGGSGPGPGFGLPPGQRSGTLTVRTGCAFVITTDGEIAGLGDSIVDRLEDLPADGEPRTIRIGSLGSYRVVSQDAVITGLPTSDVDNSTRALILWETALTLLGVGAAWLTGLAVVRRQLRPLREVAATAHAVTDEQLAVGTPAISTRVAQEHTDPTTEVGQVGHSLNTLLDHVAGALAARHASEQQVRQFVADASHELRTPLTTIHGYAELSRRTPDDAASLSAAMSKVGTEATRMSALVEDLLLLARLDQGRPLASEPVDLTRLLLESVADARVVGPDHRWRLDLPEEPVETVGDEQRLHQVVTNLLNNARNHTPAGTEITLSAAASASEVQFTVHDDGPGLPPDLVSRAFERFTRGDGSRTRNSGGAGLGLSLVRAIAEAHGGSVEVNSVPGDTTFTVRLPRERP